MQTFTEWILIAALMLTSYLLRGLAKICRGLGMAAGYLERNLPFWIMASRITAGYIRQAMARSWEERRQLLLEQKDGVYDLGCAY